MMQKVFIILWKDLLIRKNHYIATISEVLLPVALILLVNSVLPDQVHEIEEDSISFEAFKDNHCVLRHSHYGSIIYEPSTPFTNLLMTKAACYAGYKKSNVRASKISTNSSYFSIGVKFEKIGGNSSGSEFSLNSLPEQLNYTFYPTNKAWLNLQSLWRFSGCAFPRYSIPSLYNVIELQRAIDVSYMYLKNITAPQVNLKNTDLFRRGPRMFSVSIYLVLFLAFSLMVPSVVRRIIEEKFTGAKELMLMMGVVRWHLWVAKFMDVMLFLTVSVTGMVIFLYVPVKENSNVLIVSPFIFWSVIMYGLVSVVVFLFFISCFFEKSTLGVFVAEIIWACSFIFNNFISSIIELPILLKYLLCLLPHVSLMNGITILLDYDFYGKTVKFTEKLSGKEDTLTLLNVLFMMTFDIVLYSILTWYLEQVKPGKYGVPQPFNFFLKAAYWIPRKVDSYFQPLPKVVNKNFEEVRDDLKPGIMIKNVSKVFKSCDKGVVTAVDNISIDFYHDEISALLGHNGAGKTTVFSMITGLSYPSSGKIFINGFDIGVNVSEARRDLGLCPQQDMLFNDLTTFQNLKLFGIIKGLKMTEAEKEAYKLIKKLKLETVKNTQAVKLSGGQKRKVSLAIALIGGGLGQVLVLDEPTSGMDPEIRREIWDLLLGLRGQRTILLTTHFMEEADAICDRIAIMCKGEIKCYGSPMYLKSKFGKGYVLFVVISDSGQARDITNYIKQFVPEAKVKCQNMRTVSYQLPESDVNVFPALLSGLEEKQKNNEINSYSISISTLEDVFLRLSGGEIEEFDEIDSPSYKPSCSSDDVAKDRIPDYLLYVHQLRILISKKFIFFLRGYKSVLLSFGFIAGFIIILAFASRLNGNRSQSPGLCTGKPLTYSLGLYPQSLLLYSNHDNNRVNTVLKEVTRGFDYNVQEVPDVNEAILKIFKSDFYTYTKTLILALVFLKNEIYVQHNEEAVHMVPVSLNLVHNLLLRSWNKTGTIVTSVDVRFADKELYVPPRVTPTCAIEELPDFSGFQSMFYLIGPIKERFHGAKEIQLMITPASLYWLSTLIFDAVSFLIYMIVVCLGVGLANKDEYMLQHADEIFLSLMLWGIGLILIAYLISTFTKNLAAAFSVNIIIYVVFSFIIYNVIQLQKLPTFLQYLHPTCILKFGYSDLCNGRESNYKLALLFYNLFLFCVLVLKDSKILSRLVHVTVNRLVKVNYHLDESKDPFVRTEEDLVDSYVKQDKTSDYVLTANRLKRWYLNGIQPFPAVRGVSLSLVRGECFGLLGVNGAGKTSTFKMMTGTISSSEGRTYIGKNELSLINRQKYLFSIGYCPQFGGLIPIFKGKELLMFFGRLRGLRKSRVKKDVEMLLKKLGLLEFANEKCGTYSGGNQRKLSTAISLIGNCPIVFLDEPTSGVDPLSRRSIWKVVSESQKEGQSVVLTSHSMDECEALCSRLAIMVNGKFRCIGESTTLKDRFGQGYCIQLKISNKASDEVIKSLKRHLVTSFEPGCELIDEHVTILQYHVTNTSLTWADVFKKLLALKENFNDLESFTASATTLEQIFIYFSRNQ